MRLCLHSHRQQRAVITFFMTTSRERPIRQRHRSNSALEKVEFRRGRRRRQRLFWKIASFFLFFFLSLTPRSLSLRSPSPFYFQVVRQKVPLELEKGEMPLNTFNNKAPFKVN